VPAADGLVASATSGTKPRFPNHISPKTTAGTPIPGSRYADRL